MKAYIFDKRTNQKQSLTKKLCNTKLVIRFVQVHFDNGFLEPHNLSEFFEKMNESPAGFPDQVTYCKYTEITGCWKLAESFHVTNEADLIRFYTVKESEYRSSSWNEEFEFYLVAFDTSDAKLKIPVYISCITEK